VRRWISENSTVVDGYIGVLHRSKVGGLVRRPVPGLPVAGLPSFSALVIIFTSWSIVAIVGQGRSGDVERGTSKKRERHEDGDGGERRDVGHACVDIYILVY